MKKGTVIKSILYVVLLAVIFTLGFKGVEFYLSKKTNSDEKKSTIDNSKSISSKETTVTKDKSETENNPAPKEVYTILGDSNKLTPKEKEARAAWIKQVIDLTYSNINNLFINGYTNEKKVALTFDDGPDAVTTAKVLNILKENDVNGSFFFIGENVKRYPNIAKEVYNDGNLVLSHSYTHPEFTKLKNQDINKQLEMTENEIYQVIGKRPAIIRPPYGDVNQNVIDVLSKANYKSVLWSIDTLDWSQKEKANIVNNVVNNIRPGDIILMHTTEDKNTSAAALPEIIAKLKEKGYTFVTVDKLLNINAYK